MKVTIQCSEKELYLINRALELYGRIGLLQFERMDMVNSLQSLIWDREKSLEFDQKTRELRELFGYGPNSNPGVFNAESVKDDVREAFHIHQVIRHELWKQQENKTMGVDSYPADLCNIAEIPVPIFEIEIKK